MSALNEVIKLLSLAADLIVASTKLRAAGQEIEALATKLENEGRKTLTAEEWAAVAGPAQAARDRLADLLK